MESVSNEKIEELIHKIRNMSLLRGNAMDLSEMLCVALNNIASRCIFRRKFRIDNRRSKLGEIVKRVLIQFIAFTFHDYFPRLRWLDVLTGIIVRLNATFRELDHLLEQIIKERQFALSCEHKQEHSSNNKYFVDILLQLQKDGMLDMKLSNGSLKAILLVRIYLYAQLYKAVGLIVQKNTEVKCPNKSNTKS